ncbi:MAG: hypothetical protein ABFS21_10990 [Actinomycetota bacterium]
MNEMTPTIAMTDAELEEWLADAGLTATAITRCPDPSCEICTPSEIQRAA